MWRTSLLYGLVGLTGAGCGATEPPGPQESSSLSAEAQEVVPEEIEGATTVVSGFTDRRRVVIEDSEAWSAFWAQLHAQLSPEPDVPTIDFDTHVVVAATMGRRATGGYSIRIDDISRTGSDLRVVVIETSPGPACLTTQSLTAPATAVSVPLPVGVVEFSEEAETRDCS